MSFFCPCVPRVPANQAEGRERPRDPKQPRHSGMNGPYYSYLGTYVISPPVSKGFLHPIQSQFDVLLQGMRRVLLQLEPPTCGALAAPSKHSTRHYMPPKPFPSQIHIGTDICYSRRFDALLSKLHHDQLRKWASKSFNRLEWPVFRSKCQEWERQRDDDPRLFVQWLAGRYLTSILHANRPNG